MVFTTVLWAVPCGDGSDGVLRIQQRRLRKRGGGGLQVVGRFVRTTFCYSTGGLLIHGKHYGY